MDNNTTMPNIQPIPRSSKIPFSRANRRRYQSTSPPQQNQIEVQGEAYLCFSPDYSTFQGNINTSDESNYSIFGEAVVEKTQARNPFPSIRSPFPISRILDSVESTPNESEDEDEYYRNRSCSSSSSSSSGSFSRFNQQEESSNCFYNVSLTDHYTGLTHRLSNVELNNRIMTPLRNMMGKNFEDNKISTTNGQIFFRVENLYKGQKADMMIQRHIGSPALLGKKCTVYSGSIDILVNEDIDFGKSWSL